ncbi:hypothetical protein ElyMa_005605300, partial [Elysia marginata]
CLNLRFRDQSYAGREFYLAIRACAVKSHKAVIANIAFTINEALDILEDCLDDDASGFDRVNIYFEPLECQVLTDEDSADEDGVIDNLSRKQLNASCTVTACNKKLGKETSLKLSLKQMKGTRRPFKHC